MRRPLALALLACFLFLSGCQSNNEGKIVGRWRVTNFTGLSKSQMRQIYSVLEFREDGTMRWRVPTGKGSRIITGTYQLGFGDLVTFHLDEELQGRKTHTERVTIDGDTLVMKDSDGTSGTFVRMR
jgi:uncharacterized protein (TIGR03066 family)